MEGVRVVYISLRAKQNVVIAVSAALLMLIGGAYWDMDLRYSRPTPRPSRLIAPPIGAQIPLNDWLQRGGREARGRPVHLHFFNPACPCSRFNLDHLHELVSRFGNFVDFLAVIESDLAHDEDLDSMLSDLGIPWMADPGGELAAAAGVYSTPQAVVVTGEGTLYYRGNYNTSRYCRDPKTEFARLALEALVDTRPPAGEPGVPAYGCALPSDSTHQTWVTLRQSGPESANP